MLDKIHCQTNWVVLTKLTYISTIVKSCTIFREDARHSLKLNPQPLTYDIVNLPLSNKPAHSANINTKFF